MERGLAECSQLAIVISARAGIHPSFASSTRPIWMPDY